MSIFLPPSLDRAARGKKKSFAPAVQPIRTVAEVADVAKVADPLVVLPRRARDGPPAPQKRGRVRVAYSIYKNEYATVDGILDFSQMDDDFYISFVFEGDFTTRLVAVSIRVGMETVSRDGNPSAAMVQSTCARVDIKGPHRHPRKMCRRYAVNTPSLNTP
ncbi:hypothetical protein M885DRAFT_529229 [Pelagophyceae sp. CCMP2097]|nr:hypothetical protein M885DRAFT_529229 [Pelagophyceae sp. CCMP2097]